MRTKSTNAIFWLLLISAFAMGVYASLPNPKQAGQVNIPLYSVESMQIELNARGYDIAIDGKFGPETKAALNRACGD